MIIIIIIILKTITIIIIILIIQKITTTNTRSKVLGSAIMSNPSLVGSSNMIDPRYLGLIKIPNPL
jgi:hypothetical protein